MPHDQMETVRAGVRAGLKPAPTARAPAVHFTALTAGHLEALTEGVEARAFILAHAERLAVTGLACLVDGALVGAGGLVAGHPGFVEAWVIVAPGEEDGEADGRVPMRAWPAITRRVKAELEAAERSGARLIECSVDKRSGAKLAWARRLGFEPTGIRPRYMADHGDAILFCYGGK